MKTWTLIAALALLPGCGDNGGGEEGSSDGSATGSETMDTPTGGQTEDETQVPPITGHADMQAWLKAGHYMKWNCQTGSQDAEPPSPHGKQRICANSLMSGHGDGEYPVDASAVKELHDDGGTIVGYAVSRHVSAGKTGDNWYWYEVVPDSSPAPHDANGVVADQVGTMGTAEGKDLCVGCHKATGSDAAHGGHDFVYEQVK